MKIKLLSPIVLLVITLPLLSGIAIAACDTPANDSGCKGTCIDTTTQNCSVSTQSCLCTGPATRMCCTGTVSNKPSGDSGSSIEIPNPIKTNSIAELIDRIVTYLIEIATIILPLVIIYAAYLLMSAGGEMEKVILGRKTITYAVIGYILILISKGIAMIIADILGAK